jgi:RNA polymerase-binding transcription factor
MGKQMLIEADQDRREMLRKMLLNLRDEVWRKVVDFRRDQEDEAQPPPADELDFARSSADVETHAGLIARAEEKLRYIDEALARLEEGRYGICIGCHEPIPVERVVALPFAAYCVDCQEKRNRAREGWGRGATIPPFDQQWTIPEEMEEPGERNYASTAAEEDLEVRRPAPARRGRRPRIPPRPRPQGKIRGAK